MAQFSLEIADEVVPRVTDAICKKFDYDNHHADNESELDYARRMVAETIKQWVKDSELYAIDQATLAQKDAVTTDIDTNVVIS